MRERRARRAVSDVVSFTLVFSLIALTVGVVYVGGLSAVEETRNAERFDNAVRAFDVLADNLEDVYEDGAPSRATEMKLADSSLAYDDPTVVNVTVHNVPTPESQVVSVDPIRYRTSGRDSELVYEAGGVVRAEGGGGIFTREPTFLFVEEGSTKTALVPIVQTRSGSSAGIGGDVTTLVRAELALRESLDTRTDPENATTSPDGDNPGGDTDSEYNVTISIETQPERVSVWQRHLEEEIPDAFDALDVDGNGNTADDPACVSRDTDGDGTDETVTCAVAVEELFVSAARIDVDFD